MRPGCDAVRRAPKVRVAPAPAADVASSSTTMFRKRQRTGAARDVAAVVAGDDAAEVVVPRNKKPQAGAAEADRFRIGPDHQSTMSAVRRWGGRLYAAVALTLALQAIASDRYVAVSTRDDDDDDDRAQSSRAPAKANVYTGVQKEKNPFGPKKAPANLRVITRYACARARSHTARRRRLIRRPAESTTSRISARTTRRR